MKRRREVAPARRGKRSQLRHVQSEDEGSDSSTVSESEALTQTFGAAQTNGAAQLLEDEDDDEDDDVLDFTQTDYAAQQMSQAVEPVHAEDREAAKEKAPSVPAKIAQLSDKAVEDLTAQLVRYLLYKGSLKLPIKFADISKDVYPTYKNVSRYFFHRAKKQLEKVFGYLVVPVEDSTAKEVYLVINATTSQEHWQLVNKNGKTQARGFLMMVLGLLWCAHGRRLSEPDLWKQLALVDPRVKENREHPQLGDVSQLMKSFETQLYLHATSELDNDLKKVKFYTYGARTLKEVGKPQILNFVCKVITGRPPTEMQLDEIIAEDK